MTSYLNRLKFAIEPFMGVQIPPATQVNERPSLEDRARFRLQQRDVDRQGNLERIIELTAKETPSEITNDPASRDWLSVFFGYAQDVSDLTAQQFWARILALYIANPDAVSKRSLIALHGLDAWEVKAFIEYCSFAFALESGWRFVFEESITRREMWGYVQGQDYTQHFISIGLLSQDLAMLRPMPAHGMKISYFSKKYELALPDEVETRAEGVETGLGYRKFSATGQQLAKAVSARIYYGYARNLIRTLYAQRKVQFRLMETEEA